MYLSGLPRMTLKLYRDCLIHFLLFPTVLLALSPIPAGRGSMNINMPDVSSRNSDSYICTAKKLNSFESYIVRYEPDTDGLRAHHMLLFACRNLYDQSHLYPGSWECGGDLCNEMTIIYGWSKHFPSMQLPPHVGHLIGGNSSIQYLVLQIHYISPFPSGVTDNSGLKLYMTTERPPFLTGFHLLMAQYANIPPFEPKYHLDVYCEFNTPSPIHIFAYRVHTHKFGTAVSAYKYNRDNSSWEILANGNPQWPQAYYPFQQLQTVVNGDELASRCVYNTTGTRNPTHIGSTPDDEMCNLYLMYYTDFANRYSGQMTLCSDRTHPNLVRDLPVGIEDRKPLQTSDMVHDPHLFREEAVPISNSNIESTETRELEYKEVTQWPSSDIPFGQITAVTLDKKGNVVVFHRGPHVWNELSFDNYNQYLLEDDGPISVPTILTIDAISGRLLRNWGKNLFYLPHGLSIDYQDRVWVTDVALHQVFCFLPDKETQPALVLGEKFVPGNDREHFCKPTSVAVSSDGNFYVADGYCNARVIKFSPTGQYVSQWGKQSVHFDRNPAPGTFNLPHKIVLLEDRNMFCVADRVNARIQCFSLNGDYQFQIQREEFGDSVFSIAYAKNNGLLYAVSGEAVYTNQIVKAFVFNISDQKLLSDFAPNSGTFVRPHDLAVSPDGEEVYVCEIGPNVTRKFQREYQHKSTKKVLKDNLSSSSAHVKVSHVTPHSDGHDSVVININDVEDNKNFETSVVIMALLGIPILLLILVTAIIRLKRKGKLQGVSFGHLKGWMGGYRTPHPQEKFNLGNFLNPHKGFDKVSVDESDGDEEGAESDNDEFCVNTKNA